MLRRLALIAVTSSLACTPRPAPVAVPRLAPDVLAARLAEADRLASRGCYLCLKEAAAAYDGLLSETDDPAAVARALENNLMLAAREIELRMPDSGARDAADELRAKVPSSYDMYFAALDMLAAPPVTGGVTLQTVRADRERRLKFAVELQKDASASPMKAYFFMAAIVQVQPFEKIKPAIDGILAAHPHDLSLKYRMLTVRPAYSEEAARALIGQETGFGEVHLLTGAAAMAGGDLAGAFRELTRARELLPDSVAITVALANVTFAYARYADTLGLYDRILGSPAAAGLEPQVRFGRAKALSSLKRHDEAITMLDELLLKDARNSPGEKYYWRAWNRLHLGQFGLAYDDATAGLNAMRNGAIYRLAGMAAFGLNRLGESRVLFEEALKMDGADCDSVRYLGLLDSAERRPKPASGRFSAAASCYEGLIVRLRRELADYEEDITGLSNALIAAKRAEINAADALRIQSTDNAAASSKMLDRSSPRQ